MRGATDQLLMDSEYVSEASAAFQGLVKELSGMHSNVAQCWISLEIRVPRRGEIARFRRRQCARCQANANPSKEVFSSGHPRREGGV